MTETSASELEIWFKTPLGRKLLSLETEQLQLQAAKLTGYHLLHLGVGNCKDVIQYSRAGRTYCLKNNHYEKNTIRSVKADIVGDLESLPIASESIDAIIAQHAIDFTPQPHQVLRELSRVLCPGGKLVIIGFNPISLWGIWHLIKKCGPWSCTHPWNGQFISRQRLLDWLKLLDFQTDFRKGCVYQLPIQKYYNLRTTSFWEKQGGRFNWPLSAVYILVATKQAIPVTPVKIHWKISHPPLVVLPVSDRTGKTEP